MPFLIFKGGNSTPMFSFTLYYLPIYMLCFLITLFISLVVDIIPIIKSSSFVLFSFDVLFGLILLSGRKLLLSYAYLLLDDRDYNYLGMAMDEYSFLEILGSKKSVGNLLVRILSGFLGVRWCCGSARESLNTNFIIKLIK